MKKCVSFLLALLMLLSFTGCAADRVNDAPPPENQEAYTVTDMVGRTVEIEKGGYQRVVCIGAGALRMYSYVGDMNLLCGVEDIDNTALENRPKMFDSVARPYVMANEELLRTLPSCGVGGPMAQTAEAEKILSCNPDIVISEYEDADKADALQAQLGVPVITLMSGSDGIFGLEFERSLELLGDVFGGEVSDRVTELISYINDELSEIRKRVEGIAEEDRVNAYICGLGNWGTTNHLMTAQSYKPFEVANIANVVTGLGTDGPGAIEEETFVALGEEMDIIIMDAAAVKNIAPLYAEDPAMFDTCKAWREGEVYLQMAYNAYYTNYEISLINAWYTAKVAYPELFADIPMDQKADRITEAFLGKPLGEDIFACPSSFGGYQKIDTEHFFG